jgi:putative membrane protein
MKNFKAVAIAALGLLTVVAGAQAKADGPPDYTFDKAAAQGGMTEVRLGRIAAMNAGSPSVKRFGQRMVIDHSNANADLMRTAKMQGVTLPAKPNLMQQTTIFRLSHMHGASFDRAYVAEMLKDHKGDDAAFSNELANGSNSADRAFAQRTLPVIQDHLQMITQISQNMHSGNKMSSM